MPSKLYVMCYVSMLTCEHTRTSYIPGTCGFMLGNLQTVFLKRSKCIVMTADLKDILTCDHFFTFYNLGQEYQSASVVLGQYLLYTNKMKIDWEIDWEVKSNADRHYFLLFVTVNNFKWYQNKCPW